MIRRALVLALCTLGLVATTPARALEEHDCRLEQHGLPAAFARCSTLVVPQDYAEPDGPTIDLFVARIPAATASPAPDPLVLINGGPGGSGVDLFLQVGGAFDPVLRDREVILLDQRGTGRSRGGLECAVTPDLELETAGPDELRAAVEACIGSFASDPRFFTTSLAVRDLEALRSALEVERWNVYGISYGTRVAQHYLRRYPESVRAMILDGVVPADLVLGPDIAVDAAAALAKIFMRCAEQTACAARFGSLADKFAALRARLEATPVDLTILDPTTGEATPFELDATAFKAVVRLMSYAATTASLLPLVIDEAYAGNYVPLAGQADLVVESVSESLAFPMHNSVVCAEDAPFFAGSAADPGDAYLGTAVVDGLAAICEVWPIGVRDDDFKTPVTSDKPVLVLSGGNDPVTPPSYGEHVIDAGLTNARHLVAPAQGHGVAAVGCTPRIMREFLATADPAGVDGDCLANEPPVPFFLSFQGPAP